jgi:TPR repeat protein
MRKINFLILWLFVLAFAPAQSQTIKKMQVVTKVTDSAYIFYNLGWDAYKLKDLGTARYWWEKGANYYSNVPEKYSSAFQLAQLHQNGEGVGINYETAFYYYNVAFANGSKVGHKEAPKCIAAFYENGYYVEKSDSQALKWYNKAKLMGNKFCDADIKRVKEKIKLYGTGSN